MAGISKCPICKHPQINEINRLLITGAGDKAVCEHLNAIGPTLVSIDAVRNHRRNHLPRALASAALARHQSAAVQTTGPGQPDIIDVAISHRAVRMAELQSLFHRIKAEIDAAPIGELDCRHIREAAVLLRQASAEMGEWRPAGEETQTEKSAGGVVINQVVSHQEIAPAQIESAKARINPPSHARAAAEVIDVAPIAVVDADDTNNS